MKNNKKTLTPEELITERVACILDIKQLWTIIINNNIIPNGMQQKFNLNAVYEQIKKAEIKLVEIKTAIQLANLGFTNLTEIPANNIQSSIYLLQQLKERVVKLNAISTKKEDGESVVLTRKFISKEIELLNNEISKIEEKLIVFNSKVNFEIAA